MRPKLNQLPNGYEGGPEKPTEIAPRFSHPFCGLGTPIPTVRFDSSSDNNHDKPNYQTLFVISATKNQDRRTPKGIRTGASKTGWLGSMDSADPSNRGLSGRG
jgi:hypothetical protein